MWVDFLSFLSMHSLGQRDVERSSLILHGCNGIIVVFGLTGTSHKHNSFIECGLQSVI